MAISAIAQTLDFNPDLPVRVPSQRTELPSSALYAAADAALCSTLGGYMSARATLASVSIQAQTAPMEVATVHDDLRVQALAVVNAWHTLVDRAAAARDDAWRAYQKELPRREYPQLTPVDCGCRDDAAGPA